MFEIIPAIDLLEGKVVRLTKGDYRQVDYYKYTPTDLAKMYVDKGAKRIHVVDLDGARTGELVNIKTIETIRNAVASKIEVGGGIRDEEKANTLFSLGIDFVIIGSMLIKAKSAAINLIEKYAQRIIVGLDARGEKLAHAGWLEQTNITLTEIIQELNDLPVAALIYTDINKDGTFLGPNIEELNKIAKIAQMPIIASGGVKDRKDIEKLRTMAKQGIIGCIVGKAILAEKIDLEKLF
jgi:phosphoribosylformimino-5-aminoimidazole carboxamide ribotide isomerase